MQKPVEGLAPGAEITCPRCGAKGKVGIDRFKAAGREYLYWTVRHYENGRVRRCVIAPYQGAGTYAKAPEKRVEGKVETAAESEVPEVRTETKAPEAAGGFDPVALDRAAWYSVKVLLAYGAYRAQPSEETLRQLLNVLKQVRERLGVDVSTVETAIAALHARQSTDNIIVATTAIKELVKAIIAGVLAPGTQVPAQAQVQAPLLEAGDLAQALAQTLRDAVREEVSKVVENLRVPQTPEVRVEVPREVVETISAVRDQVQVIQREIEYIREQVRQRKGWGARAVVRGERRIEFKPGNMYWMLREIMRDGKEWTKEALAEEIRRRFKKEVSGNSVSGRLSELAAAGYVSFRREGRKWYWRWIGS
jgi:hypothetical protein